MKKGDMVYFVHKWEGFRTEDMGIIKTIKKDNLLIDNNVNSYWIKKKEVKERY